MEKQQLHPALPVAAKPLRHQRSSGSRRAAWTLLLLAVVAYLAVPHFAAPQSKVVAWFSPNEEASCVQPEPLFPSKDEALDKAYEFISSEAFRNASIGRLSGAVRVKSESFDDLGPVGEDPRWEVFFHFYAYLQATFPLIHEKLKVEKVNTHGLFYTWEGSDASLKPTLLMAHQDTVPVPPETLSAWTHPPWSGYFDGKKIWGRGASDCKNQLIGVMETIELLLETSFKPKRTILLSFGFDEECSGYQGALPLANFIHKRYGDNSLAIIVDEGSGFQESWGALFAKPGTGEKGYLDVHIVVRMPGGHSSIPADHTGIGVLSELITKIESSQYPTFLEEENPYYSQLQCGASHAPDFPSKLKKLLARRGASSRHTGKCKQDQLALEAAKQGPQIKYLMQTSQAVDVISGGVKVNALPERVQATVNHRINVGDTSQVVYDRLTALAGDIAKKYNLTLHAFDGQEQPSSIMLVDSRKLEVAPVSPTDGSVLSPFSVLAGTVRALYGTEVIVAPGISTGNTDTKYYWDLTKHIFRFGPGHDPEDSQALSGVHTVDENVNVVNHINLVKWFTMFLRNMDEVDLE